MADEKKPGRIVGPDGRVPKSLRSVQTQRESNDERPATVGECRSWITAGSIAAMKQVYEQMASESERNMTLMEDVVVDRVLAELRRRTIMGRLSLRWVLVKEWARGYLVEIGLVDPMERSGRVTLEKPA